MIFNRSNPVSSVHSQTSRYVESKSNPAVPNEKDDVSGLSVSADGSTAITLHKASSLLGVNSKSLLAHFSKEGRRSILTKKLIEKGFDLRSFESKGIPDTAFAAIVTYYAFKAGRSCTAQAEVLHDTISLYAWTQGQPSQHQRELVKSDSGLAAIADSMQALTASVEQMSKQIAQLEAGLNDSPNQHSTQSQIARLIGSAVSSGQSELCQAWAQFYQSVEMQCRVNLELERRNLEIAGIASPKKLDAIESLGLLDAAFAIASELFASAN